MVFKLIATCDEEVHSSLRYLPRDALHIYPYYEHVIDHKSSPYLALTKTKILDSTVLQGLLLYQRELSYLEALRCS